MGQPLKQSDPEYQRRLNIVYENADRPLKEIAKLMGVSHSTAHNQMCNFRRDGKIDWLDHKIGTYTTEITKPYHEITDSDFEAIIKSVLMRSRGFRIELPITLENIATRFMRAYYNYHTYYKPFRSLFVEDPIEAEEIDEMRDGLRRFLKAERINARKA